MPDSFTKRRCLSVFPYLMIYIIIAFIVLKFDFNSSNFPMGTNILNSYVSFFLTKNYGLSTWYPYSDWGGPSIFIQPTIFYFFILNLPIPLLIRIIELFSWILSGFSMFYVVSKFSKYSYAAFVSGLYYMLMIQTSQFFEGHLFIMTSFALVPLFYYLIYKLFLKPTLYLSLLLAFLLYLLSSIGDLGILYMILFFAIPEAVAIAIMRNLKSLYSSKEFLTIITGLITFIASLLTWIIPYFFGVRQYYTTNINVNILNYFSASGISPLYVLSGFFGDNSYIYFDYGKYAYSLIPGYYYFIFAIFGIALLYYGIRSKTIIFRFLAISALFDIILATGTYFGAQYNILDYALYYYFPFFSSIPALFRWGFFIVFAYSILLGKFVDDVFGILKNEKKPLAINIRTIKNRLKFDKRILVAICLALVVITPILQNSEVFTNPPTSFTLPQPLSGAYRYIGSSLETGYSLDIPFGIQYEITPWGKLSQSSSYISPVYTNETAIMYQAGNPYSLAMDQFIGNGLAYSLSNNLSKYFSATNIQYVVSTNYSAEPLNYSYASSSVYDPQKNFDGLTYNLQGAKIKYASETQKVYEMNNSGNISFSNTYFIYYGGDSTFYQILNQPWYKGAETPLINISQVSNNIGSIVGHSSGLIVNYRNLEKAVNYISFARESNIPIIIIFKGKADLGNGTKDIFTPYVSSQGLSTYIKSTGAELSFNLTKYGLGNYSKLGIETRAFSPFNSSITINTLSNLASNHSYALPINVSSSFENYQLSGVNLSHVELITLNLAKYCTIDTISIILANSTSNPMNFLAYKSKVNILNPKFQLPLDGYFLLTFSQTYNQAWTLNSNSKIIAHVVSNIGLNGWLIHSNGTFKGEIFISSNELLSSALEMQEFIFPMLAGAIALNRIIRRRKR